MVIVDEHVGSDRPGQIRAALDWLKRRAELASQPPDSASIEIEVGESQLMVTVDRDPGGKEPQEILEWTGRNRLDGLAQEFRSWRPYQPDARGRRLTDYWQPFLSRAGKRLLDELRLDAFGTVRDCLNDMADQGRLHFRFNLHDDDGLVHVPFELIHHQVASGTFLREVSPVARRLVLKSGARFRQNTGEPESDPRTVLFISSNVWGTLEVPECTFEKRRNVSFKELSGIEEEWQAVKDAHYAAGRECYRLDLLPGDPIKALKVAMRKRWDIIHFSGHSIRADDGQSVFLVLPGKAKNRPLTPLAVPSFADLVGGAGARLVILSSCESSSIEAIVRLAQYGVSTVVGFRWEVLDEGAKVFTSALHQELANLTPIGRAFLQAIKDVRDYNVNAPTFHSPMLLVQSDSWA